ncbi:MAG: hypothetical protein HFH82_07745 [Lachnospiraceae bacterium]|nr:hypothetical protein [Lachnospiraceae bacterium]
MVEYEQLLQDAANDNVQVFEQYDLTDTRLKGLYCDGAIALNKELKTKKERKCVLAEELGHHYTATGDILDQSLTGCRKQEIHGRAYAYNRLVGLMGIIDAYKHQCTNLKESAEYLDVTEEFLDEAVSYYKSKYGTRVTVDNYTIFFEPYVAVLELV